jgi:hypothetical protein
VSPYNFNCFVQVSLTRRFHQITQFIIKHKRCFLEQPVWRASPSRSPSEPKTVASCLQDIFSSIPGVLEDHNEIELGRSRGDDVKEMEKALYRSLARLLRDLTCLRQRWEDENPSCCHELETTSDNSAFIDEQGSPLLPSILHFSSFPLAFQTARFDTMFIITKTLTCCIPAELRQEADAVSSTVPLSFRTSQTSLSALLRPGQGTNTELALEICRLIDYCVLGDRDQVGAFALPFSLRIAHDNLIHDNPKIAARLRRLMAEAGDVKGFGLGRSVLDIHPRKQHAAYM